MDTERELGSRSDLHPADLNSAGLHNVPVRCVPLPLPADSKQNVVVYVLTQERLMSLLYSQETKPSITTLIIDEAQGLKEATRGVILHSAIDEVLNRCPQANLHFASPMSQNPEYLPNLFKRSGKCWVEEHSPVSQNVVLVSSVLRAPSHAAFELLVDKQNLPLGQRDLGFPFTKSRGADRLALFSKMVTSSEECTIVYANRPRDAEKVAESLASPPQQGKLSDELEEFIEFLEEHVHHEYPLIQALKSKVAFHYGEMPGGVRSRIEELFEDGQLQFICCTSTLLQGVNLPAKNIVIENPRRGNNQPMERGDFLNLAGRAGRLLKEFHGNIWCLNPSKWDNQSYEGDRLQPISAAFPNALDERKESINGLLDGLELPRKEREIASAVVGKIFSEFTQVSKRFSDTSYCTTENKDFLQRVDDKCFALKSKVTLPADLFKKNSTIYPLRLQSLYERLKKASDIETLLPLMPYESGANLRMTAIFRVIEEDLAGVTNRSYIFHAFIASAWIHDVPLKRMIESHIEYQKKKLKFKNVGDSIRSLMKVIETDIRYRYVKHLKAYNDVIGIVISESHRKDLLEKIVPLHLFLECGASDPVVLNLISIGLTRTTALLLKSKIAFPDKPTPETCLAHLRALDIPSLGIPALCRREVEGLLS